MLNLGAEALLGLQADLLVGIEFALTDWMHRRHEAVLDAQRLIARARETQDTNELLRAQQEWMAGALRRMAADAASFQSRHPLREQSWAPKREGITVHR